MRRHQNLLLVIGVVILAVIPLLTTQKLEVGPDGKEVEIFAGSDGQAEEMIGKINPSYTPWFKPLIEPPSAEIESLLFALQAALGAGFIGYYFGGIAAKGQSQSKSTDEKC